MSKENNYKATMVQRKDKIWVRARKNLLKIDVYLASLAMDKNLELVAFDKGFKKMSSK